jgi:hypothetical protein
MSIELAVKRLVDGAEYHLPVSTTPAFQRYWLPAAQELRLSLVPQMMDALFLLEPERRELRRGLRTLADWFATHARAAPEEPGPIEERIVRVLAELEQRNCIDYELSFC